LHDVHIAKHAIATISCPSIRNNDESGYRFGYWK